MTLIEIVVVVSIVTIMMAAIGVKVMAVFSDAKIKLAKTNIRAALEALDTYKAIRLQYPTAQAGFAAVVSAHVMKAVPKDPWGTPLLYALKEGEPVVLSLGADGQTGGVDEAADISSETLDE
jgi:general secretion pathway protein G